MKPMARSVLASAPMCNAEGVAIVFAVALVFAVWRMGVTVFAVALVFAVWRMGVTVCCRVERVEQDGSDIVDETR
jgi:hypothetical protein